MYIFIFDDILYSGQTYFLNFFIGAVDFCLRKYDSVFGTAVWIGILKLGILLTLIRIRVFHSNAVVVDLKETKFKYFDYGNLDCLTS